MELADLEEGLAIGYGLTVEERSVLETEMAKRKMEEGLSSIKLWGRVHGMVADYLVVCGLVSVMETPQKKFYYATNKDLALKQMPEVLPEMVELAKKIAAKRFSGNPTTVLQPPPAEGEEEEPEEEEEEEPEAEEGEEGAAEKEQQYDEEGYPIPKRKPRKPKFTEAHRLAFTVGRIDGDCFLVPRGAFIATPTHHIVADPLFCGLSASEATLLDRYLHFRPPTAPARALALTKAAILGAGDFMDPASEDGPKGVWGPVPGPRLDAATGVVSLRSLKWPGYCFFHRVNTPSFGSLYWGDGRKATDLHFMMEGAGAGGK